MNIIAKTYAFAMFATVQCQAVTKPTGIAHPVSILFDGAHLWVVSQLNGPQHTGSVFEMTQRGAAVNTVALTAPSYLTGSDYDGEHIWVAGAYDFGPWQVDRNWLGRRYPPHRNRWRRSIRRQIRW